MRPLTYCGICSSKNELQVPGCDRLKQSTRSGRWCLTELYSCSTFVESNPVKAAGSKAKSAALLGLAFDAQDDQTRVTRGDNFLLWGGSQDTHAVMQETAIKVNEHLQKQGKRLEDASIGEIRDICQQVNDSIGK